MPNPDAKSQPYGRSDAFNDPNYATACPDGICDSYGLRIYNSKNIMIYAAGLYVSHPVFLSPFKKYGGAI